MSWVEQLVAAAHGQLGDRERESLWGRGVSDDQIAAYRLGWLNKVLPDLDYPASFLDWSMRGKKFDDVFVLPMTNVLGHVKGIQVRHLDRERKGYSNFNAVDDEPILFGLGQAVPHIWRSKSVWLVEGAFDLFPLQRVHPNTISTMTARLPTQLARTIKRLADDLWLGYDRDETGQRGVRKIQQTFGRDFRVHAVQWPRVDRLDGKGEAKDPADLWEAWGDDRFGVFIRNLNDPRRSQDG